MKVSVSEVESEGKPLAKVKAVWLKLGAVLTLLYPFALFGLQNHPHFSLIALSLGGLLILNLLLKLEGKGRLILGLSLLVMVGLMRALGLPHEMRLYPFLMSLAILMIFILTKDQRDNPMIGPFRERAIKNPRLLLALHQAKGIWIAGLVVNTLVLGLYLFAFSLESWVLFASFYSYLLLLALFVVSLVFVIFRTRSLSRVE